MTFQNLDSNSILERVVIHSIETLPAIPRSIDTTSTAGVTTKIPIRLPERQFVLHGYHGRNRATYHVIRISTHIGIEP